MSKKFISLMLAVIILMSSTAAFAKPKTIYVNPKGTYDHMLFKGMRDDTDEVEFPDGELDIAYMQVRLKYYGYYSGSIDGIFGTNTRNAILNFQRRNNLNVDGKIGANTWYALAADDSVHKSDIDFQTIRPGTKGEQVRNVQRRLRVFYNYNGPISGEYDSATIAGVKSFQQSVGLSVDGIVGEKTYNALNSNPSTYFSSSKAPRRTLYMGMRGYDVYILKLRLISLQYLPSSAVKSDPEPGDVSNGYFDLATKNALKRLQVNNGVSVTGQADAASRRYMWSTNTLVAQQADEAMDPDNISEDTYYPATLSLGSHGASVRLAQMYLIAGGYYTGVQDGVFGVLMENAVKRLQRDKHLKIDGKVGPQTWPYLRALTETQSEQVTEPYVDATSEVIIGSTRLQRGSWGTAVKALQQKLIKLGYLNEFDDDGKFGYTTEQAVRTFQRREGLKVDGIVGTETYSRIQYRLGFNL